MTPKSSEFPALKIALTHVDLPNQSKGGVAQVVHQLANQLTLRGHDVTLFSFSPAFEECLYRVAQLPSFGPPKLHSYAFAWRLRAVDFSRFDVLHTHGDNYLTRTKCPQVRTFHGAARDEIRGASLPRKLKQALLIWLEKRGARVADICTGVSLATQNRIPEVTRIVPNGVDIARFSTDDLSPDAKSKNPTILFVGTREGRKRGAFLAEIFAREVLPNFPDAELWSVADAPLDAPNIRDLGRVSSTELTRLFRETQVFCLPSTYEGFGVPYIEAMAAGTPVVASPNAGALEVTEGGKWGVIAKDVELGAALNRLLGDASEREKWANLGSQRAQIYAWENVVAAYEAVYREAINAAR